jgi:hypothetical protein
MARGVSKTTADVALRASGKPGRGHLPFAVWNRSGNRVVSWLLRSPLHRPLSGRHVSDKRLAVEVVLHHSPN